MEQIKIKANAVNNLEILLDFIKKQNEVNKKVNLMIGQLAEAILEVRKIK